MLATVRARSRPFANRLRYAESEAGDRTAPNPSERRALPLLPRSEVTGYFFVVAAIHDGPVVLADKYAVPHVRGVPILGRLDECLAG